MIKGYIFITSTGYDPEKGKSVEDPYLGKTPTLGACMTNIRRYVVPGDQIYIVSGKVAGASQYVIGGFEVAQKIDAIAAYDLFPEYRLRRKDDGQITGNIIVNSRGEQHSLDTHDPCTFKRRIENYIIGRNPVALTSPYEIARGREETLGVLRSIFRKSGNAPIDVIGRSSRLDPDQMLELWHWLSSLKSAL